MCLVRNKMDREKQIQLKELMSEYFGKQGMLILLGAVRNCGLENLIGLSKEEKSKLIDYLIERVFSKACSINRLPLLEVKLISIFD